MKSTHEIAIEALIGAAVVAVASGLLLFVLALAGVNPDEVLEVVRKSPGEDRAQLLALLLGGVLLVGDAWRRWGPTRKGQGANSEVPALSSATDATASVAPRASASKAKALRALEDDVPTNKWGKVRVGEWIPGLDTVEHADVLWTTMMTPISDAEMMSGAAAPPDPEDIDVRYPPLCPKCRTDLDERTAQSRTLEEAVAGGGREMFCVNCGWKHSAGERMSVLHGQAQKKARGAVRRLLKGDKV